MKLNPQKTKLLEKITELKIPASTKDRKVSGEGIYVDLIVDYDKYNLPKAELASLWKNGYLTIKDGILVSLQP